VSEPAVRILAFDTATRATSVAWLDTDRGVAVEARDDPEPGRRPRHTTHLMGLVKEVLDRAGGGWDAVDRIAVGLGPGTFTGLRIGIATARALARAREIPLVGVSTLESLALGATEHPAAADHDVVLAVLDARRGEVFAAAWPLESGRMSAAPRALLEPLAIAPDQLAETAATLGQRRLAIGDGAVEFRTVLERSGTSIPESDSRLHRVGAIYHCRLAASLPSARGEVWPQYLRLPDAELSLRATPQP
jgi:tRNA threonylcarbamoyladenosine biosynthesis protein TsaB